MRYLRLYLYCIRFSFSKAMEFRLDFFFRIVMDIVFYLVQFIFFKVIYLHTPVLGGWSENEIILFVAGYIFIDALNMTIFSNNCWAIPLYINRGDLDFYLTKPVSTLFFLSLRDFAANSFINLLFAIAIIIFAILTSPLHFTPFNIFLYLLFLVIGTILFYIVHMFFLLCVFWTGSGRGFGDLFYAFSHVVERPDQLYRGVVRKIFTTILPFAIMASFPTKLLIGESQVSIIIHMLLVTFILFILMVSLWKKGLRSYSSASS